MIEIIPHTAIELMAVQGYLDEPGITLDTRAEDNRLAIA
jgi:hypothetical protein